MLWLANPPWGRWLLASLLIGAAFWSEFRTRPTTSHPFASSSILAGEVIGPHNTSNREVPIGLLDPVNPDGIASRKVTSGEPLLAADVADIASHVPSTWWVVEVEVPSHADKGDEVKIVLLDSGEVIDGVLAATPEDDPFGVGTGGIAVAPEQASHVAVAAAEGRIAVIVSSR